MRLLITGSREWTDRDRMEHELRKLHDEYGPLEMCHGAALGADRMSVEITAPWGWKITPFPVTKEEWRLYGKPAGIYRNERMFREFKPDLVVGFPMPSSRGTVHMMKFAREQGCPVLDCGVPQLSLL